MGNVATQASLRVIRRSADARRTRCEPLDRAPVKEEMPAEGTQGCGRRRCLESFAGPLLDCTSAGSTTEQQAAAQL